MAERLMGRRRFLALAAAGAGALTVGGTSPSYVAVGDSITAGSHATEQGDRYANRYRNRASEVLGPLSLDNRGIGGDTSGDLLAHMRNQEGLREAIRAARIVTIYVGYNDIRLPRLDYRRKEGGGADGQNSYRATVERFGDNFSRIMYVVQKLKRRDALVRAATVYYPQARPDEGLFAYPGNGSNADVHRKHLGRLNGIVATVCQNRGARVAPVYWRFNGRRDNGSRRDPLTLGYIADDGIHPNNSGHQALANAFDACGYTA